MKLIHHFATLGLIGTLAACGTPDRFTVAPPAITETVTVAFRSIEVRDVSLPSYAAADEISQQTEDGTLVSDKDILWADAPERALSLEVSRNLTRITGVRVASEPWPFEAFPEARLDIRFADIVARTDGTFSATGQYFVGVPDGRRERSGLFDLTVPYDPDGGPKAIAAARGQIVLDLSYEIARKGLR